MKLKKFIELSDDIKSDDFEISFDKIKSEEFEIVNIIDIFYSPEAIDKLKENFLGVNTDLTKKEIKRGDEIYITAMIRKKGSSMTSPSTQAVIKLRVVDIYNGLSYLNKFIN